MKVPGFIARQFYVSGSLRNTPDGFQLEAHNPYGSGTLVGLGQLRVDGREIPKEAVTARRAGDQVEYRAPELSSQNPIRVQKGDRVTLRVTGDQLKPGDHILEVELHEMNVGQLSFALSDRLAEG